LWPKRPHRHSLEINRELGLHEFLRRAAGAVAEDDVVLPGLILGRGQTDVYILVMRRIGGKECFACVAADKISVLVFVQDEEVDVRVIVVWTGR
jgi:hypothetical protein